MHTNLCYILSTCDVFINFEVYEYMNLNTIICIRIY